MELRMTPFKYKLTAVLRKHRWEGQMLGVEAVRARQVFEEKRKRYQEVLQQIAQTESETRELYQQDQQIPLEQWRILQMFLRHQYAVAADRQADVVSAEAIYGQVMAQLQSKHRTIKGMENHQERKRREHDLEQIRLAQKAQDDSWLLRRR